MQLLSQLTGGKVFQVSSPGSVDQFLADTIAIARHQYSIGYPPPAPARVSSGHFHRVEVRCRRPGVKVICRPGYYDASL